MKELNAYEPPKNFSNFDIEKETEKETKKDIEKFKGHRSMNKRRRPSGKSQNRRFWRRGNRYRRGGASYNYLHRTPYYYYDYPNPWYYSIPYVFGNNYYEMPNDAYFVGGKEEIPRTEKGDEEVFNIGYFLKGNTVLILILIIIIFHLHSKK